jgi:hypothetical protein
MLKCNFFSFTFSDKRPSLQKRGSKVQAILVNTAYKSQVYLVGLPLLSLGLDEEIPK